MELNNSKTAVLATHTAAFCHFLGDTRQPVRFPCFGFFCLPDSFAKRIKPAR